MSKPASALDAPPKVRTPMNDEAVAPPSRSAGGSPFAAVGGPFSVIKPSQGSYVRWCSAIGLGLLSWGLADFLYDQLALFRKQSEVIQLVVPAIVLVIMAYVTFYFVGRHQRTVDFMIATEGEMKKVNWSTRREVFGATRVVIFTFLMLGMLLFLVDVFFMILFELMGILRLGIIESILGAFGVGGAT